MKGHKGISAAPFFYTGSGAGVLWLFQRISALLLLGLLMFHAHYVMQRFICSGALTWADLTAVLSHPFVKVAELAFFFLGTLHGMNGLWSVVNVFVADPGKRRLLAAVIAVPGIFFLVVASTFILLV
ncbi:MAG: hypothetical protein JXA71_04060 [Chitinispirillaceae bacterium]|nr:hypothetical protein [Chitinispirillaceae bacterium]